MAFGGTAKTYASWELIGEPFEEEKRQYIIVRKPGSSTEKKVRWYNDKAHAALMPSQATMNPFWELFGFENDKDYIIAIRKLDLSEREEKDYFFYNWKSGGKWTARAFFGGCWIAPKTAEIPPIKNKDKVFMISWPELKKEGQKNVREMGFSENTSPWFM